MGNVIPDSILEKINDEDPDVWEVLPDGTIDEEDIGDDESSIGESDLDLSSSVRDIYPSGRESAAFVTTLLLGITLAVGLILADNYIQTGSVQFATISIARFNSYFVYGYCALALSIGTGISTGYWYVRRAPPEIDDRLEQSPLTIAIITVLLSLLFCGLVVVGSWIILIVLLIAALVFVVALAVGLTLFIPGLLYGVYKKDSGIIAISLFVPVALLVFGVLEGIWPTGVQVESYALLITYVLTVVVVGVMPNVQMEDELDEYLQMTGKAAFLRSVLERQNPSLQNQTSYGSAPKKVAEAYNLSKSKPVEEELAMLADAIEEQNGLESDPGEDEPQGATSDSERQTTSTDPDGMSDDHGGKSKDEKVLESVDQAIETAKKAREDEDWEAAIRTLKEARTECTDLDIQQSETPDRVLKQRVEERLDRMNDLFSAIEQDRTQERIEHRLSKCSSQLEEADQNPTDSEPILNEAETELSEVRSELDISLPNYQDYSERIDRLKAEVETIRSRSQGTEDTDEGEKQDRDDEPDGRLPTSLFAELTDFRRDILVVLAGTPDAKGLTVKEELEQYYEEDINHGRLYPNLDTLADKGLVDKYELDKRSNGYRLTDDGKQLLHGRITWEREKSGLNDERAVSREIESQSVSESEAPDSVEAYDTLAELPVDTRYRGEATIQIVDKEDTGQRTDARMSVRDSTGETATLDIWTKHEREFDWSVGEWYVLSEVRMKEWESDGSVSRNLSSTRDMKVELLPDSGPATAGIEGVDIPGESTGDSDETDDATGEEEEEDDEEEDKELLEDIVEEFDEEII